MTQSGLSSVRNFLDRLLTQTESGVDFASRDRGAARVPASLDDHKDRLPQRDGSFWGWTTYAHW